MFRFKDLFGNEVNSVEVEETTQAKVPFPKSCKVGDRCEVRDKGESSWTPGTVLEVDDVWGPRVRKDGFDGVYFWDRIRPVLSAEEARRRAARSRARAR